MDRHVDACFETIRKIGTHSKNDMINLEIAKSMNKIGIVYKKLFYQFKHQNFFTEFNKTSKLEICNGIYLFGNCKSKIDSIYYKCNQHSENITLFLCKSCLDKFENEKYFSVNHSHPFKEHFKSK